MVVESSPINACCFPQAVFRPADDVRMGAAICSVVEFVESPTVGGSRNFSVEVIIELLTDPRIALPDLGVVPEALLRAAIARGAATVPGVATSITVAEWLSVSDT